MSDRAVLKAVGHCGVHLAAAGATYFQVSTQASACPHTTIYVSTPERERPLRIWRTQTDGESLTCRCPSSLRHSASERGCTGSRQDTSASRGFNPIRLEERVGLSLIVWGAGCSYRALIYVVSRFKELPIGVHIFIQRRAAVRRVNLQELVCESTINVGPGGPSE